MPGDWRHGADPAAIEARLAQDKAHAIKAVMVVHNETSTGVTSRVGDIRAAIDSSGHPALLLVDTISSLGSVDYRHDEWKVDVTVSCSQKGFMLPPGLGFNAISEKARAAAKTNKMPRSYWDWEEMLKPNAAGFFPYTPATNLLYGLREAIAMLLEEGLENVFARHKRLAAATRAAVTHWGLEVLCQEPAEYSPVLTAVLMPPGHDADQFRKIVLDNYNMSLGSGLSKLAGKVFRIGHLGECNELTLLGALTGVEMGLSLAGVPHRAGGVAAAMTLAGGAHPLQCIGPSQGDIELSRRLRVFARANNTQIRNHKRTAREDVNAASFQGHPCRAGDAVRHVLHHLCRSGQHRHGGQRNPEGIRPQQHPAWPGVLGLRLSLFAVPGHRRMGR